MVNDFSLVHALLGMAMRKTSDEQAARLFQASRNRVRVIALLHAVAWRTETGSPGATELRTYLEEVLREAERARATHGRVRVELETGGVALPVSEMAAAALCVSELVHNALAHAFPGDRRGHVRVTLGRGAGSNDVLLRVTDDGIGMPADATEASAGLGLALVRLLAEQLSGELTCGSNEGNGTDFCLRFSNPEESRVWPTS
ncbi:MAG TPA: sensor histidine kinase [Polyangiaceae bacterium]